MQLSTIVSPDMSSLITPIKSFILRIGQFWQEKFNGQVFRWNLFFIGLQVLMILWKFTSLPPEIPLYYSRPWGASQLVSSPTVFLPLILSAAFLILNNALAVAYFGSIRLLSQLLIISSLLFSAFSAITLYRILSMVA